MDDTRRRVSEKQDRLHFISSVCAAALAMHPYNAARTKADIALRVE